MATYYNNDNIYTHSFTPKEYQIELLDAAKKKNTIVCSSTGIVKAFLSVKIVQELSWQIREENGKRSLFLLDSHNVSVLESHFKLFTDLSVTCMNKCLELIEWHDLLSKYSVILMTVDMFLDIINIAQMDLSFSNLLVIDDCLYGERQNQIKKVMKIYDSSSQKPRIIVLISGLLGNDMIPNYLESEMIRLEELTKSVIDPSTEITAIIKHSVKPNEIIIHCENPQRLEVEEEVVTLVMNLRQFLLEHRYDPTEIYPDEFRDEFAHIPDPKLLPLQLIDQFLGILQEMGIFCANQAALNILILIEKLKVKVAYERHYLLLCVLSTIMVSVRSICDELIENSTEEERLDKFCSAKIKRFVDVLLEMGPPMSERPAMEVPKVTEINPQVLSLKGIKRFNKNMRKTFMPRPQTDDAICGLIFVRNACAAQALHSLLSHLRQNDERFWWINALYTVDKTTDPATEPREADIEHRRQEDVLRKFRSHECNVLVATSVLEQGYDLPKCNLVVRFDLPNTFHSYVQSKSRARSSNSYFLSLVSDNSLEKYISSYACYFEIERILLRRCVDNEPNDVEIEEADKFCESTYAPYRTPTNEIVSLTTAIQLINRYCAKLPSDTFTKLVPIYEYIKDNNGQFSCKLRLPINSPIKDTVHSPFMTNRLLAKRFAAFFMCQLLHKSKELDDSLNPISKENFRASEEDWNDFGLEKEDEELSLENTEQRPGTTKRRQYYYKRIAGVLRNNLPVVEVAKTYFYRISMTLTCPIPEEQNTRGRKIYPPEESKQGFGILTSKEIPPVCAFPIFTRSGEVNIKLELCSNCVLLTDEQIFKIKEFLNYTFTSVLRLQKYQMLFDPSNAESSYLIVPTITIDNVTDIDWKFLEIIFQNRDAIPTKILDEERSSYQFDSDQYVDAVVMPWYRNQDQPQYFYVAEICTNLNPASEFPGSEYSTFQEYYERKYNIIIQNKEQYLLDVDHTSARLNFLTPRYVNRKGVALPTSSEETKKAKRENLEQKQILVPELCAIHPFPASLWRKAVCLPCILYRINALLLANEIRGTVAKEIGLGCEDVPKDMVWPALNFGWNLCDVLNKSKPKEEKCDNSKTVESKVEESNVTDDIEPAKIFEIDENGDEIEGQNDTDENSWKIGTWSNDMVDTAGLNNEQILSVRYGSPTSWIHSEYGYNEYDDDSDSFNDDLESHASSSDETDSTSKCGRLQIQFTGDFIAEAVDVNKNEQNTKSTKNDFSVSKAWIDLDYEPALSRELLEKKFYEACKEHEKFISENIVIRLDQSFKRLLHTEQEPNQTAHNNGAHNLEYIDYPLKISGTNCDPEEAIKCDDNQLVIEKSTGFSFDEQPPLEGHTGTNPSVLLQALTMSNANDGINLERLETIGDSFLKYAITDYLYSKYENTHEGKLSHLRSKQVSNLNLYRLGKRKRFAEMMIATKFDPHDNWLPPGYCVSKELEEALMEARIPVNYLTLADYVETRNMSLEEIYFKICDKELDTDFSDLLAATGIIPYNLVTQHSIPDKSIADCVEALIGAYLIECGPRGALLFMAWLGVRVLPVDHVDENGITQYGNLKIPNSPLLHHVPNANKELELLLAGYDDFELSIGYRFRDRSYLLQSLTHASYYPNRLTDCYQRLEFLGDAVLDYLITRHLYEDQRMHSPGALTDLRSALVNNTIFASLAVRFNFHKYFKYLSPALHVVIEKFIRIQEESGHRINEELFLLDQVDDNDMEIEDVEVPKVLGDVFESVAGAIFLDSGRSLDAVWQVYYRMMKNEINQFSDKVPKSPIRELLELEPETAKFGIAEKLADGRRVRVTVEVFGKGIFKGIGRNYRIAKCTAAKCALKHLKKQPTILITKK